ncbi:MAG: SLC13 family permease [Oleispira antarctica]|nr:SLC13 family permease [Oleispira antarctica]MBQ0792709.1 SLC13 family permease [Oleispira antarctica]
MNDLIIVVLLLMAVLGLLISNRFSPEKIFLSVCAALIVFGILPPAHALVGFSSSAVFTIAFLYVVVGGLRDSGGIQLIRRYLVGSPKSQASAINRILPVTTILSGFVNNTPVVATFTHVVQGLSKRYSIRLSQVLIPISFASIFGGMCTLIGTSTNLVVDGLVQAQGYPGFGLFELAQVGVPIAIMGLLYLKFIAPLLLPNRESSLEQFEHVREYMVEMIIQPNSELVRNSIQDAGLRNLPGLFLVEIEREGQILSAVRPRTVLEQGDRLVFAGSPESVLALRNIQGLVLADDPRFKLEGNRSDRRLFEAVLSPSNTMIGKSIKESRFRHRYSAVVLSVSRHGERLTGRLGDLKLQAGDTLLIEAQKGFLMRYRNSRDFLLVSKLADSDHADEKKAVMAISIFIAMIIATSFSLLSILESSLLAAGAMVATRCISFEDAGKSIDYSVLVVIACAFSLGAAVQHVGLAGLISDSLIEFVDTPILALIAVYLTTALLTELMTNNAAAIIMLPIAITVSEKLGVDYQAFAVVVMIAASASFMTPTGYQTNLMVMGPGGYRFSDYFKVGAPLSALVAVAALILVPIAWPLV